MFLSPPLSLLLVFFHSVFFALLTCNVLGQKNDRQLRKPVNCELLKDGNYVWDCSSYYSICANGRELPMECYSGLKLNPNSNQCDAPSSVRPCHRKHGTSNVLYRAADPFNCQENIDGDYEASACSTTFYTCIKGQKLEKHCPPGLVYNTYTRVCDFASKCRKKPYNKYNKSGAVHKAYQRAEDSAEMRTENEAEEEDAEENDKKEKRKDAEENGKKEKRKDAEENGKKEKRKDAEENGKKEKRKDAEENGKKEKRKDAEENGKKEKRKDAEENGKKEKRKDGEKKTARKRRAISFLPSSPQPSPSAFGGGEQMSPIPSQHFQQMPKAGAASHYTIFNLYNPKNVKFNVVRSDKKLDNSVAVDDETSADFVGLPKIKDESRTVENFDKAYIPAHEMAKDFVVEEIADVLMDAIKDL